MGKPAKKKPPGEKLAKSSSKNSQLSDQSPKFDADTSFFIDEAQKRKEEGNKLFQRRDYQRALIQYERAINTLPKSHPDVAYLHSNMAACYMQIGPSEYRRAVHECDLALEVSPKYTKALLKRARCYEFLGRLDFANRDVDKVLSLEPNNLTAAEISERIKSRLEKEVDLNDKLVIVAQNVDVVKEKTKKKETQKVKEVCVHGEKEKCKHNDKERDKCNSEINKVDRCKSTVKNVVVKETPLKAYKLVFGEDIRWGHVPENATLSMVRKIVSGKYPGLNKLFLIKYRDKEGDLVTITMTEELKLAEESADPQGSVRLYISEGTFIETEEAIQEPKISSETYSENGSNNNKFVDEWIVEFAKLFKNHVGISSDSCLDLHKMGMKLFSEAIEDTVTCKEAEPIFDAAQGKFKEMAALAFFNWGNIHMSRARKCIRLTEEDEMVPERVNEAYEGARQEYRRAEERYNDALKAEPNLYEGHFAIALANFEHAKLCWNYVTNSKVNLESSCIEVLEIFNKAEDNIEIGTAKWEEIESRQTKEIMAKGKGSSGNLINPDMRCQINVLWGAMLYERSIVESQSKLGNWDECLLAALDKFLAAGASETDIAVIFKNHCANETAPEGCNFKIDEIIQAWNETYDAERWIRGLSSFRLEPLLRRKTLQLY